MFFHSKIYSFPVDLVYLWCDGSDPEFSVRKKQALCSLSGKEFADDAITDERWTNHDELKYSLRSVCRFLPWINNIFILLDQRPPEWLKTDFPRLKCIYHKDVFPAGITGPYFNSTAIETFLHRIPGLKEHFLFANDDHFVGRSLHKSYFFTRTGQAIHYVQRAKIMEGRLGDDQYPKLLADAVWKSQYERMIVRINKLLYDEFGRSLCLFPSHQICSYNRSVLKEQIERSPLSKYVQQTRQHTFRDDDDLQRTAFAFRAALQGHLKFKYIMGCHPRLERLFHFYWRQRVCATPEDFKYVKIGWTPLFCLNGTMGDISGYYDICKSFLEKSFPEKSPFEK